MEEDRIAKAADLLRQASNMLMAEVPVSSQTTAAATRPETPSRSVLPSSSSVADTLRRARSMMDTSSRQGLYRRLSRNERLRAGSVEGKHAKKDNELQIRQKIKLCLEGKYEIGGENDFEFVKPALEDDDNGKLTNEVPVSTMIGGVHTLSADDFPVGVTDPIEMLKYVQSRVLKGRELNVSDLQVSLEGDVNYITIERDNILTTTFDELKKVHDFRLTFQVQFYGQEEVFLAENPNSECIAQLRNGLDVIGIRQFGNRFPGFLHLFREPSAKLSVKMLLHLLKPNFAEDGSNKAMQEKSVYSKFVKYVREAASGRRIVSLGDILQFVTGSSEEPALGFELKPCIQFTGAIITNANNEQTDAHTEKRKSVADF
eukprot:gene21012-23064_t